MAEQRAKRTKNQRSEWSKFEQEEACRVREGKQQGHVRTHSGRLPLTLPAAMSTHSFSPDVRKLESLGQEGSKVAWSGFSRSLVLERGPPEFVDFRLVCVCFNGRNVRKALCGAKKPRGDEDNTYSGEINVKVSDFTKLVQNHLKWLAHSVCFLEKKARRVILCFSVQNDQVKKCETTGFEPGKSCPGFL